MSDRSGLLFGRVDNKPFKRLAYTNLTGKPRIRPHIIGEIEHVLFHRFRRTDSLSPSRIDIDMAGRAGAGPAAFRLDAGNGEGSVRRAPGRVNDVL